jgi:putative ABC transport system permease protein
MERIPAWRRYARFFGVDVARDVDEELRFHLEEKTRDLIDRGMNPEAARLEALRQFGAIKRVRQQCRELGESRMRTIERRQYWNGWWQDLRYAIRTLRKAPIVTAVAVLSIALGVGANTAIFSLFDQVLLRKLAVADPDCIVRVSTQGFYYGSTHGTGRELSYPVYVDIRDRNQVFDGAFAMFPFGAAINDGDRTEMAQAELVSGTYFQTLGIGAIRGRVIGPDEDRPGGPPVAVVSHAYWQQRFGADPHIVGRTLTIRNQPITVIGVVQPGFDGLSLTTATQLFLPVTMETPTTPRLADSGLRWLKVYARLKPGVTAAQAQASLEPLYRSIREREVADPRFAKASAATKARYLTENHLDLVPGASGFTPLRSQLRAPLQMLMAIVCGVLLIACANVANLLLARGAARQRDIALRLSLGATRGRIVRQMLVESMLLALAGGAAGVLLASGGVQLLIAFFTDQDSHTLLHATPDLRILAFTLIVSMVTGVLFGIVPAFQSTRPDLAPALQDRAASVLSGQLRVRKALVISQVTLSLLLLIAAGLFLRRFNSLMHVDLGFKADHLVTFGADPTLVDYTGARAKQYATDLLVRMRSTPGVSSAAFARLGLLWGGGWSESLTVEGYRAAEDEVIEPWCNAVSPGYFETMGIPLLLGRDFRESDARAVAPVGPDTVAYGGGYRVAIVTESFAKRYLGTTPLGRHIGFGIDPGTPTRIEVVGVVGDSIYTAVTRERSSQIYLPYLESPDPSTAWFFVRTGREPETMLDTMRSVMRQLEPNVPPQQLWTFNTQLKRSLVNERMITGLSTVFGVLATMLAMVGLYGVMAYTVTRRTREIGVRVALGAEVPSVIWLIMREAVSLVAAGIAIALPLVWWLGRYVESQLYGMRATDPLTIGLAMLVLATVGGIAGMLPALRAARIDPIGALRQE